MRALGVDFGGTRIGIAVMETGPGIPSVRPSLSAAGALAKDAEAIAALAKKEEADLIVVGIPLSEGEETKMSRICRMLAERLRERGWRVELADEALTSHLAEESLRQEGLTAAQVKKRVDGEAAMRILSRWREGGPTE